MIDGSDPTTTTDGRRTRDDISPVSVAILALLVIFQFAMDSGFIEKHLGAPKRHTLPAPKLADADAAIKIDMDAKMSYVQYLLPSEFRSAKEIGSPHELVKTAEGEFRKAPGDPAIARRLILLRAEAGDSDPLRAIPARGKHKALPSPITAFDYPEPELVAPRAFLVELFTSNASIDKAQEKRLEHDMAAYPSLLWYRHLALHQIYLRAGDKSSADRELRVAGTEAAHSLLPVVAILIAMMVAGMIGLILLIHQLIHSTRAEPDLRTAALGALPDPALTEPPIESLWPDQPDPGAGTQRLGAGDLFNIFVCYMFAFASLEILADVAVYWLVGHRHAFVIANKDHVELWTGLAHQIATSVCAFAVLLYYVKSRRTTVAKEIWLRAGPVWQNIAYGFAGWSMGLPLMAVAALVSAAVFSKLTNPSNPVISMITSAHGLMPKLCLFFMACILAPVIEETMFRGAFYQAARARLGVWPAIIVTGVLFGGIHPVGLAGAVPLMVLGSVFAWMAEKRKSLLPGMVAHFMINAMTYFQLTALSG